VLILDIDMTKEKIREIGKRLALYIILSIGLTFILVKSIESKNSIVFWTFMGTMGVSAIIARWFDYYEKKNKIVKIIEHIAYICFFTLILSWLTTNYIIDKIY